MHLETLASEFLHSLEDRQIRLPVLPDLAFELHDLMAEQDYDPALVTQALSQEPGVTAALVRSANPVLNRGRVPVATLDMAIMRLGRDRTHALANAHLLKQLFHGTATGKRLLKNAWERTQATAVRATFLADQTAQVEPAEALLLVLLQNLGALPLVAWIDQHEHIDELGTQVRFDALEATAGPSAAAYLLDRWKFPSDQISDVAQRDHWSRNSPGDTLTAADTAQLAHWSVREDGPRPGPALPSLAAYRKWQALQLPVEPGIGGMGDPDQEQRISELGQLLGP